MIETSAKICIFSFKKIILFFSHYENVILLKKFNNWQNLKSVPWLSHYEEVCRTSPFVAFEYRDTYIPPQEQPPMSTDHTQHEEESRSYNPYLIAYHEDTNTFTYNDPWVEITHEDVCNSNYNENYVNEQNSTQSSLPTTTNDAVAPTVNTTEYHHQQEEFSSPQTQAEVPQPEHKNDLAENNDWQSHATENPPQQHSSPAIVEKVVEHVNEEVSLSRDLSHSILAHSLPPTNK